ncbi:MAG: Trk system potassium transporter TrkA [Magnetococcales bacterium]|nr:Trk system potassium transporter TrkA [Magnetococcales bacterium]
MNVIIFGAGMVGNTVAKFLTEQDHNVTLVDHRPEIIQEIQESLDIQTLLGEATGRGVMQQAGLEQADLVLAVTDSDETNIVLSLIVQSQNRNARTIVRLRGQHYMENSGLWQERSLDRTLVFSPEQAAVERLLDLLEVSRAFEVTSFLGGAVRIAGFSLDVSSPLIGQPLMQLAVLPETQTLIVAVEQQGEIIVPTGKTVLQAGDRIYVTTGLGFNNTKVRNLFGLHATKQRKVLLAGGGWMGARVAEQLLKGGIDVTIIERDRSRCRWLAETMDGLTVINGGATDHNKMRDELDGASTFVGITNKHEVNFIAALMAHKLNVKRVIAVMDNEAYLNMAPSVGIDAAVSPKLAAVGMILRILRTGQMIDVAPMLNGRLEAVFVEVRANSRLDHHPINRLGLPKGVIIAAVMRDQAILIPHGNLMLTPGDKALFIAPSGTLRHIGRMLEAA